jgi:hypothetical protein
VLQSLVLVDVRRIWTPRLSHIVCLIRMQFIRGSTLDAIDPVTLAGRLTENSFEDVGKLFVVDVLINNFDRIPGNMWSNDGNIGNLMITSEGRIYGIDQAIVSPNSSEAISSYLAKVTLSFQEFKANPSKCKMVQEIWSFLNLKIGDSFCDSEFAKNAIAKGIQDVLAKIETLKSQEIIDMKNAIQNSIQVDWENVWVDMCALVDTQFVIQVIRVLAGDGDKSLLEI